MANACGFCHRTGLDDVSAISAADAALVGPFAAAAPGRKRKAGGSAGGYHVHRGCAVWSPLVHETKATSAAPHGLVKVEAEVARGAKLKCTHCRSPGASLGCFKSGCPRSYHYPCAWLAHCQMLTDDFQMFCPPHRQPNRDTPATATAVDVEPAIPTTRVAAAPAGRAGSDEDATKPRRRGRPRRADSERKTMRSSRRTKHIESSSDEHAVSSDESEPSDSDAASVSAGDDDASAGDAHGDGDGDVDASDQPSTQSASGARSALSGRSGGRRNGSREPRTSASSATGVLSPPKGNASAPVHARGLEPLWSMTASGWLAPPPQRSDRRRGSTTHFADSEIETDADAELSQPTPRASTASAAHSAPQFGAIATETLYHVSGVNDHERRARDALARFPDGTFGATSGSEPSRAVAASIPPITFRKTPAAARGLRDTHGPASSIPRTPDKPGRPSLPSATPPAASLRPPPGRSDPQALNARKLVLDHALHSHSALPIQTLVPALNDLITRQSQYQTRLRETGATATSSAASSAPPQWCDGVWFRIPHALVPVAGATAFSEAAANATTPPAASAAELQASSQFHFVRIQSVLQRLPTQLLASFMAAGPDVAHHSAAQTYIEQALTVLLYCVHTVGTLGGAGGGIGGAAAVLPELRLYRFLTEQQTSAIVDCAITAVATFPRRSPSASASAATEAGPTACGLRCVSLACHILAVLCNPDNNAPVRAVFASAVAAAGAARTARHASTTAYDLGALLLGRQPAVVDPEDEEPVLESVWHSHPHIAFLFRALCQDHIAATLVPLFARSHAPYATVAKTANGRLHASVLIPADGTASTATNAVATIELPFSVGLNNPLSLGTLSRNACELSLSERTTAATSFAPVTPAAATPAIAASPAYDPATPPPALTLLCDALDAVRMVFTRQSNFFALLRNTPVLEQLLHTLYALIRFGLPPSAVASKVTRASATAHPHLRGSDLVAERLTIPRAFLPLIAALTPAPMQPPLPRSCCAAIASGVAATTGTQRCAACSTVAACALSCFEWLIWMSCSDGASGTGTSSTGAAGDAFSFLDYLCAMRQPLPEGSGEAATVTGVRAGLQRIVGVVVELVCDALRLFPMFAAAVGAGANADPALYRVDALHLAALAVLDVLADDSNFKAEVIGRVAIALCDWGWGWTSAGRLTASNHALLFRRWLDADLSNSRFSLCVYRVVASLHCFHEGVSLEEHRNLFVQTALTVAKQKVLAHPDVVVAKVAGTAAVDDDDVDGVEDAEPTSSPTKRKAASASGSRKRVNQRRSRTADASGPISLALLLARFRSVTGALTRLVDEIASVPKVPEDDVFEHDLKHSAGGDAARVAEQRSARELARQREQLVGIITPEDRRLMRELHASLVYHAKSDGSGLPSLGKMVGALIESQQNQQYESTFGRVRRRDRTTESHAPVDLTGDAEDAALPGGSVAKQSKQSVTPWTLASRGKATTGSAAAAGPAGSSATNGSGESKTPHNGTAATTQKGRSGQAKAACSVGDNVVWSLEFDAKGFCKPGVELHRRTWLAIRHEDPHEKRERYWVAHMGVSEHIRNRDRERIGPEDDAECNITWAKLVDPKRLVYELQYWGRIPRDSIVLEGIEVEANSKHRIRLPHTTNQLILRTLTQTNHERAVKAALAQGLPPPPPPTDLTQTDADGGGKPKPQRRRRNTSSMAKPRTYTRKPKPQASAAHAADGSSAADASTAAASTSDAAAMDE